MRTSCVKNGLVVGVILLFVGVAVQPSIAIVQPECIDVEYLNVNTEFIGLGKEFTVQLTQQQMDELDSLFESIRERLNNSEIKEETVQIFNDAIVELDRLGLLGDYSVKQVQELVTGRFQKPLFYCIMDMLNNKIPLDNNTNTFCLISGRTNNTYVLPPLTRVFNKLILFFFMDDIPLFGYYFFIDLFGLLFMFNLFRVVLFSTRIPITLGSGISLGGYIEDNYGYNRDYFPAEGWINTFGSSGNKKWNGSFYGQISGFQLWVFYEYIGVIGFTGIKILNMDSLYYYYLGSANYVNIDHTPP